MGAKPGQTMLAAGLLLAMGMQAGTAQAQYRDGASEDPALAKITPELRLRLADSPDDLFRMIDTNDDGELTPNESKFDLSLRKQFRRADEDVDNRVSLEEYRQWHFTEVRRLRQEQNR